jgi:hypothetical protein
MRKQTSIARRCIATLAAVCLLVAPVRAQNSQPQTSPQQASPQPAAPQQAPPVNPRQGPPAPPPAAVPRGKATIRSTVSLVEVDVQVTDRDGKPIKGLKQEQFDVTEDGKIQKVSTFEYNDIERVETAGSSSEAPITVPI